MTDNFVGFTQDSFDFFADLAANNHTAWFKANRDRYDRHVLGAFRGLLVALEPFLMKLDPHFETAGKTNRNFSRINRDIRFSKDKSPYKSNYYLYLFDSRYERGDRGRFYVGLSAECVTAGFSIYSGAESNRRQSEGPPPQSALESVFRKRVAAHDVSRAYIRELDSFGYHHLPLDQLVELRIHGVSTAYIRELRGLGYHLPPDELVQLRIRGVTPEFATTLKNLGYGTVPADQLVQLRIHGVTPEYMKGFRDLGYGRIALDDLVQLRIHGVSMEFVNQHREMNYGRVNIEKLVQLNQIPWTLRDTAPP